jgi:hypothetical protein
VTDCIDKLVDSLLDVTTSQIDPLELSEQRRHVCIFYALIAALRARDTNSARPALDETEKAA